MRPGAIPDLDHGRATVDGRTVDLSPAAVELLYHGERGSSVAEVAALHGRGPGDLLAVARALAADGLVGLVETDADGAREAAFRRTGMRHTDGSAAVMGRAWRDAVAAHGASPALVLVDGRSLTYAECDRLMDAVASGFRAAGLRRGDRVALWAVPHLQSWLVFWSALRLGVVLLPLDPTAPAAAVGPLLARFGMRVLLADAGRLAQTGLEVPSGTRLLGLADDDGAPPPHSVPPFPLAEDLPADVDDADPSPDDPALFVLTSGTTAASKAVCQSHGALWRSARDVANLIGWGPADRVMTTNGFSGFRVGYLAPVLGGGVQVLVPPPAPGHVPRAWDVAGRNGVTMLVSDPAFVRQSLELRRTGKLPPAPALHTISAGGANLPPSVRRAVVDELGVRLGVVYGLTEACGLGAIQFDHSGVDGLENTVGRMAGMVAQIRDASGRPVVDGEQGRLWLLTDRPMSGYVTDAGFDRSSMPGGWIDTGDIAWRNSRGDIVIVGRAADFVSLATGQLVSPSRLEDALAAAPGVAAAAVLACVDDAGATRLFAFVEPAPGGCDARRLSNELRVLVRDLLGPIYVPQDLQVRAGLPRNAQGKVTRSALGEFLPPGLRPVGS
ncbi:MAG: class I adenylate-forming enzyme family protein [Pseudomonadota bacterium]|nr:class I adenylate-forming enzyme family protein [Pseudomonadota bacterium]